MTRKTQRSWGWVESPLCSYYSIKWRDLKVSEHSNHFDEHGLFVVPQASLQLKSISDMTKCTTGVQHCHVRRIYFPWENYFTAATKRVISSMQSFTKKISGRKGKDSAEIFEHCSWNLIWQWTQNFPDVCKFCARLKKFALDMKQWRLFDKNLT